MLTRPPLTVSSGRENSLVVKAHWRGSFVRLPASPACCAIRVGPPPRAKLFSRCTAGLPRALTRPISNRRRRFWTRLGRPESQGADNPASDARPKRGPLMVPMISGAANETAHSDESLALFLHHVSSRRLAQWCMGRAAHGGRVGHSAAACRKPGRPIVPPGALMAFGVLAPPRGGHRGRFALPGRPVRGGLAAGWVDDPRDVTAGGQYVTRVTAR